MALNQEITSALQEAERKIFVALQAGSGSSWISVFDENENPNLPTTEREVLVFICGDRKISDSRPDDAPYGLRFGYFDHSKNHWRVDGRIEKYVTHWRECPDPPIIS